LCVIVFLENFGSVTMLGLFKCLDSGDDFGKDTEDEGVDSFEVDDVKDV
jgi:hypothetical protein